MAYAVKARGGYLIAIFLSKMDATLLCEKWPTLGYEIMKLDNFQWPEV